MKKYNLSLPDIPCNCNELAQAITGKFHNAFVQRWGDHTCNQPGCESVLVLDGNMKNTRQVCSCRDVGELKFAGMDGCVVIDLSSTSTLQKLVFGQEWDKSQDALPTTHSFRTFLIIFRY
ncbi:uncharacterized protein LOC122954120 [Acropora millepora]|uniref:uncharacterized protein LOC122954120 n=1 Tax=Acropora millepora TaxID=45264 RepID=UPI001CF0DEEF|nr:uncharacterized protein LOC122954120 [Acropora millepora]